MRKTRAVLLGGMMGALAMASAAIAAHAATGGGLTVHTSAVVSNPAAPSDDAACAPLAFDARVELGEAAERKEELKPYHSAFERQVGDHFAETMRSCFAAIEGPDTTAFVLVADITAEGTATAVEVRPATNIARCFAAGFVKASFPAPPPYPDHDGFPITIKMRME